MKVTACSILCAVAFAQQAPPPQMATQSRSGVLTGIIRAADGTTVSAPVSAAPAQPARPEDLGSLAGRVVNATTGEPVRKATVTLRPSMPVRTDMMMPPPVYTTSTDASGTFAFAGLEPGQYVLSAERTGFVHGTYSPKGGTQIASVLRLAAAEKKTGIDVEMTPQAVITGRVVDEDGDPLVNVQITVLKPRYTNGKKQMAVAGGGASTNDQGEYRIFGLAPGKYYVSANSRPVMFSPQEDRSANSRPDEGYVSTYYPGTSDIHLAVPVDAQAGATLQGIDLPMKKSKIARIRGRVLNQTGSGSDRVMVMLRPSEPGAMGTTQNTRPGPDGQFEFRNLPPGSYSVMAGISDGTKSYSGRQTVELGDQTIDNVVIPMGPPVDISGQLRADDASNVNLTAMRIALRPSDGGMMTMNMNGNAYQFGANANGQLDAEGRFTLAGLPLDRYQLTVTGMPAGFYIKSARLGDADVLESPLDLVAGAAGPLRIVISGRAGQIQGTVTGDQQAAAAQATVVVVPESPTRREQQQFYRVSRTDAQGAFNLRSLEPGRYTLYAWQEVEPGAWMDPEFLKGYEGKGKDVSVSEGDQARVELKVN